MYSSSKFSRNWMIICLIALILLGGCESINDEDADIVSPTATQVIDLKDATIIVVAPDGSDLNDGTVESPLATFRGARDKIRLLGQEAGHIVVQFRGGEYVFSESVVLGPEDSGSPDRWITYTAYPDETPIFTSAVQVVDWEPFDGEIMVAEIRGERQHVRYLQDASEGWLPRSATEFFNPADQTDDFNNEIRAYDPEGQPLKMEVRPPADWDAPDWSFVEQYDLRVSANLWVLNILPLASFEPETNTIRLASPSTYEMRSEPGEGFGPTTEAWVLNSIAGIDEPGEWASLDGRIYLYPKSGTDDIYIPTLTELIVVDGGGDGNTWEGDPIGYIRFEGIVFTGADFIATEADHITTQHDWGLVDAPASLLRIRNAEHVQVVDSTFTKSGGGGVRLDRYAQHILIDDNDFSLLGREAILLGGRGIGYGDVNKHNEISNNRISTPGREKWDSPAINLSQSSNNTIHHNLIEDTYMSAVHLTSGRSVYLGYKAYEDSDGYFVGREGHYWEVAPSVIDFILDNEEELGFTEAKVEAQQFVYNYNNIIEKNVFRDIHDSETLFDNPLTFSNGMIYVSGGTRNETNILRLNYFYDSDPTKKTQLLYADSYMDNLEVLQNMVYNVQLGETDTGEEHPIWDYNGFYEDGESYGGRGLIRANVILESSFVAYVTGLLIESISDEGNIDFEEEDDTGADEDFLDEYIEIAELLCSEELPGDHPLPGVEEMIENLIELIEDFDGEFESCLE